MNIRTMIKGQRCTNTIHGMGAVSCDLSMAFDADQCTYVMLTRHIIATIVVMIQTFIHFGVRHCADVSKAIGADQCTYVMLTRHIIAIIIMMNQTFIHVGVKQYADVSERGPQLGADQRTQTHCDDVSIHGDSVSDEITQLNTHVAPHSNPSQNDGYVHTTTTPWEVRAK